MISLMIFHIENSHSWGISNAMFDGVGHLGVISTGYNTISNSWGPLAKVVNQLLIGTRA